MPIMIRNGVSKEWKDEDVKVLEPRGWVLETADDIDAIRETLDERGIKYDKRMGVNKLKELL